MLRATPAEIDTRTREVAQAAQAAGWSTVIVDGFSTVGGGSSPGSQLPTRLLRLERPGLSASEISSTCDPRSAVVARIHDGHVVLDLRTLLPNQDRLLAALLAQDDQTER